MRMDWLEYEMTASGMRNLTCEDARRASTVKLGSLTKSQYVNRVRYWLRQGEYSHYVNQHWDDWMLILVGYRKLPPRDWAELLPDFLKFWDNSQPRPNVVGSDYNADPDTLFRVWSVLGRPELPIRSPRHNRDEVPWHIIDRLIGRLSRRKAYKVYKLLVRFPQLGLLAYGDIIKLTRAGSKVQWAVARSAKRASQGEGQTCTFYEDGNDRLRIDWEKVRDILNDEDRFLTEVAPKGLQWRIVQNYVPKNEALKKIPLEGIKAFNKKAFMKAFRFLSGEGLSEGDAIHGAVGLTMVFGANWRSWLKYQVERRGVSYHDATYWLPQEPVPGFAEALRRWVDAPIHNLAIIAKSWNSLTDEEKSGKFVEALAAAQSLGYGSVKDRELAKVAAMFGYGEYKYHGIEQHWLRAIGEAKYETIPSVRAEVGGYSMERLAKDDRRCVFLGDFTDCCQHPGGAAETSAWHGIENPDGAFYVVKDKKGVIAAQSWVWRNGDVVMFDNIEVLGDFQNREDTIVALYEEVAKKLLGTWGIREVRVGAGNSDVKLRWEWAEDLVDWPTHCWSDAKDFQYIIAKLDE